MTTDEPGPEREPGAKPGPERKPEPESEPELEFEFDVVMVGSGAAGMTAALTAAHQGLSVVVIEKTAFFGGSTARSGGGLWVPGNEVLRKAGVRDTPEQASAHLAHVAGGCVSAARERGVRGRGPPVAGFAR